MSDLLAALQFEWTRALDREGCVRVLAVDIAGAFDKVSHRGLLRKAEALGISGELLEWIRSYLSDRKLQAVLGGHTSPPQGIDAGVPQGSILGPILFLFYVKFVVNNLEYHLPPGVELAIYADETAIYKVLKAGDSADASCANLQAAVGALSKWGRNGTSPSNRPSPRQ